MELVPNEACTYVARAKDLINRYILNNYCEEDELDQAIILLDKAMEKLTKGST